MKFSVTQKVFVKFPDAKFGALFIKGLNNSKLIPEINTLLKDMVSETLTKYKDADIKKLPEIKKWREVFQKLGLNRNFLPSHEALLARVIARGELSLINPLVDLYNIVSLKNLIPIGGHDTDKVSEIRIDETTGNETFQVMNSDEVLKVKQGEIAYMDKDKILTRNFVWRQAETDKTTETTKNVFIPIDNASGDLTTDAIRIIAEELCSLITKYLGGKAFFGIVDKNNTEVTLEKMNPLTSKVIEKKINISKGLKVNTDPKKVDEVLTRGCVDIIIKEEIRREMLSGRQLNVYYGIDPSGKDMHLGHASTQRKVRDFQELGHNIILLVGDYTVRVGDHSDQEKQREDLSDAQIEQNMKHFKEQYGKTVDLSNVKIVYNSQWLKKLRFIDVIGLAKIFTVQQMIEREAFAKRLKANNPIGLDELLYPLMQGYDALALKTDIQIEGTDQLFNMIAGRKIMEHFGMKPQGIITMPMLIGPDGREMHKSLRNYIGVMEDTQSMFGKIMSMKDELMHDYYILLTRIPLDEIEEIFRDLKKQKGNPMDVKKRLAFEITRFFDGEKEAMEAQAHFEKTVQNKEIPLNTKQIEINVKGGLTALELGKLLVEKGVLDSNSEAKRLIEQGGLQVDGKTVTALSQQVALKNESIIKIGKRKFVRINL